MAIDNCCLGRVVVDVTDIDVLPAIRCLAKSGIIRRTRGTYAALLSRTAWRNPWLVLLRGACWSARRPGAPPPDGRRILTQTWRSRCAWRTDGAGAAKSLSPVGVDMIAQAARFRVLHRKRRVGHARRHRGPFRAQPMSTQTDGNARSGPHRVHDTSRERKGLLRERSNTGGAI